MKKILLGAALVVVATTAFALSGADTDPSVSLAAGSCDCRITQLCECVFGPNACCCDGGVSCSLPCCDDVAACCPVE